MEGLFSTGPTPSSFVSFGIFDVYKTSNLDKTVLQKKFKEVYFWGTSGTPLYNSDTDIVKYFSKTNLDSLDMYNNDLYIKKITFI